MNVQHKTLAGGRWKEFPFLTQMANVASEVERSLNWRAKGNSAYAQAAFERALELIDLTAGDEKNNARLREILRARELFVDFFMGVNEFHSTEQSWRKYFSQFIMAARRHC